MVVAVYDPEGSEATFLLIDPRERTVEQEQSELAGNGALAAMESRGGSLLFCRMGGKRCALRGSPARLELRSFLTHPS